jgi:hypothetical protein
VLDNRVIDRYTLELEAWSENEHSPLPDDKSTAEAWLSLEMTRALLNLVYGNEQSITDSWMQQLENYHSADLIAQCRGSKLDRCVLNSAELLPFWLRPR